LKRQDDLVQAQILPGAASQHRPFPITSPPAPLTSYLLQISRVLLFAALFGAPLAFGAVVPWAWMSLGLVASLALFLWGLGSILQGELKVIWSPLYIPLAIFVLLGVVQYAARMTLDKSETRQALVLLITDLVFFFLAVQHFGGNRSTVLLPFGLVVLVFVGGLGLFAILQSASGAERIYGIVETPGGVLFGPYVDRDHFAGLMEMLLPVAVLYIVGRHGRLTLEASIWRVCVVALGLASLLLAGSRGGLLALSAEIAVSSFIIRRASARIGQRRRLASVAALALVAGGALFAYMDPGWAAKKLGSIAYVDRTWAEWTGDRKKMAGDTLRMWRDHPLLGVGLGDFETAYPRYQSYPSDTWVDHAHNDYLEAGAETGLVGGLIILCAVALFLRLAFRNWNNPFRSHAGWIRLGAAIGCCGMLVHSLGDFNFHIPANALWFAVLAGIAATKSD